MHMYRFTSPDKLGYGVTYCSKCFFGNVGFLMIQTFSSVYYWTDIQAIISPSKVTPVFRHRIILQALWRN